MHSARTDRDRKHATHPRPQRLTQLTIHRRGGARRGAGRKPKGRVARVSHTKRPALASRFPVLVTLKLEAQRPSLRRTDERQLLLAAFRAARERHGMRLVHYSIQSNHIHALVEARDSSSLTRGMRGLCVRVASGLNRLWTRTGRVLADRFHARILRTPREVHHALRYVLNNALKHGARALGIDPFSSGIHFDGWAGVRGRGHRSTDDSASPVAPPRSWLMVVGWRRHGPIRVDESPARTA